MGGIAISRIDPGTGTICRCPHCDAAFQVGHLYDLYTDDPVGAWHLECEGRVKHSFEIPYAAQPEEVRDPRWRADLAATLRLEDDLRAASAADEMSSTNGSRKHIKHT